MLCLTSVVRDLTLIQSNFSMQPTRFILLTSIIFFTAMLVALSQDGITALEEYIETIAPDADGSASMLEQVAYLRDNPLYLSQASVSEILQIPTVSFADAIKIYEYLQQHRKDWTLKEIYDVVNFNKYQIEIFEQCVIIENEKTGLHFSIRERSKYQIEETKGLTERKYLGDAYNLYQNYNLGYENEEQKINANLLLNKNIGEVHLVEFMSGNVSYNGCIFGDGELKIVAGDFSVQFGLGNVYGPAFYSMKGINAINPIVNYTNKLSAYNSKMDCRVLRGGATRLSIPLFSHNNLTTTLWYSNAPRSGTYSKDSSYISSIYITGAYRTNTEILKKNNLFERNAGVAIEINGCDYSVGVLSTYLDYGKEIRSNSGATFRGQNGFMNSVFTTFHFGKLQVASELSFDNHWNAGFQFGSAYKSKTSEFALGFRSFEAAFRSPYAGTLGEFSNAANEIGLYAAIIWKSDFGLKWTSYVDAFQTYEPTYTIDTNVVGFELFSQADYQIDKKRSILFRFNFKNKTNEFTINKKTIFYQRDKLNLRGQYDFVPMKKLNLSARLEVVHLNNQGYIADENGIAGFIDVRYAVLDWLKLSARTALYSTKSFASTIWMYEYFYPGYALSTSVYDEGTRTMLGIELKLSNVNIYFRYTNLFKPNVATLGSGNEQVNTNAINRIYCQIDFKF